MKRSLQLLRHEQAQMAATGSIMELSAPDCLDFLRSLEEKWVAFSGPTSSLLVMQKLCENVGSGTSSKEQQHHIQSLDKQVAELYLRLDELGQLNNNTHLGIRLDRVMKVMGFYTLTMTGAHRIQESLQDRGDAADMQSSFYSFSNMTNVNFDDDFKTNQKLILHLTTQAQIQGYRRYLGAVYKPFLTPDGYNTHSWIKVHEMKEFVYKSCSKERFLTQWKWLTERGNAENAVSYLTDCEDYQFPRLNKDRHAFSYPNGIYLADQDTFHPYGSSSGVATSLCCAKYFNVPLAPDVVACTGEDIWTIATPAFDTIVSSQAIPPEAHRWLLVFLGRLLYEVGAKDNWQVVPYIKGASKSTYCAAAQQCAQSTN